MIKQIISMTLVAAGLSICGCVGLPQSENSPRNSFTDAPQRVVSKAHRVARPVQQVDYTAEPTMPPEPWLPGDPFQSQLSEPNVQTLGTVVYLPDEQPPVVVPQQQIPESQISEQTFVQAPQPNIYPIDLANALGLGGANHLQIQMAREQVIQAQADLTQARALILPSLRFGVGWNKHDGRLQQTDGKVLEVSRGSLFVGGGAGLGQVPLAGGAGGPARLMVNLSVADAIFQPRVMKNLHYAAAKGSGAVFNDSLLQVATGYIDMLEVHGRYANAQTGLQSLDNMVSITTAFEKAGEATRTEVDRARTQQSLQKRSLVNLDRQTKTRSAELVRLLRLEPTLVVVPVEPQVTPIEIVDATLPIEELIAMGVASRPEVCQQQGLVWAAGQRVQQEQYRPWLPNVQLGTSAGQFGGGEGSTYTNASGRSDVDVLAVWEVQNLGFGNKALRNRSCSELREASLRRDWVQDQIKSEVVAAANDVNGFREQIAIAQEAAERARETYEMNLLKIREGEGLPLELIQAINSLVQSLDAYVGSVCDYNRAQFRLLRAIGSTPSV